MELFRGKVLVGKLRVWQKVCLCEVGSMDYRVFQWTATGQFAGVEMNVKDPGKGERVSEEVKVRWERSGNESRKSWGVAFLI